MLNRIASIIVLFALNIFSMSSASTIQVPADFRTIQEAINQAVDGDTVLVADGSYPENINFRGKNMVVASWFAVDHDALHITATVINGSTPAYPDTASCVLFISGEDSSAVLEGFTLTGGTGTRWPDIHIGGFYREGGGILIELASPTIKNNLIMNNEAINRSGVTSAGGGAIRCGDGNPRIFNNVIMSNRGRYGAAIVLNFSGGIIKNNVIINNSGGEDYGGSGIWVYSNGPAPKIIENNTIVGNSSTGTGAYGGRGGAMMVWSTAVEGRNNIIWGNSQSNGDPIARIGGAVNFSYCDIEGGFNGDGNIDLNPAFADSNYYLTPGSPCVDSGDTAAIYNDPEDSANPGFALRPSLGGLRNDMGAYGGPLAKTFPFFFMTAIKSGKKSLPQGFRLEQNFPNPFNPQTEIRYSLPKAADVTVKVFSLLGQEVKILVSDFEYAGSHSVIWNGTDANEIAVPSGIYFYRMEAGDAAITNRMALIR